MERGARAYLTVSEAATLTGESPEDFLKRMPKATRKRFKDAMARGDADQVPVERVAHPLVKWLRDLNAARPLPVPPPYIREADAMMADISPKDRGELLKVLRALCAILRAQRDQFRSLTKYIEDVARPYQ